MSKRAKIWLLTVQGAEEEEAELFGQWAVHRSLYLKDFPYTVSHAPSGLGAMHFRTLEGARKAATYLQDNLLFPEGTPLETYDRAAQDHERLRTVGRKLRELGGHYYPGLPAEKARRILWSREHEVFGIPLDED